MEGNLQEYLNNEILGNVRTGTRGDKDNPVKLGYFDVHTDRSTSKLAVEIFNKVYNNPDKLRIRFVNQSTMEIGLQRYEGKKLRCYGNNKQARLLDEKGKRQIIECNAKECPYRDKKQCKVVGRLYFIIEKLEDEGVWCYPMGSEKGIKNIWQRIARANRIKEDLTKDWYELYLRAEDAIIGKNYIPDIKKIEMENNKKEPNNVKEQDKNNTQVPKEKTKTNNSNQNNMLMLKGFSAIEHESKKAQKMIFVDTKSNAHELILMPEGKQDILQ